MTTDCTESQCPDLTYHENDYQCGGCEKYFCEDHLFSHPENTHGSLCNSCLLDWDGVDSNEG